VRDEFAWFTFEQDLCRVGEQAYDWALAVDAQRMTEILHTRAGRFNQSLADDPDAGFTIEEFRVPQWWPTIQLHIRGRSVEYDTGFTIEETVPPGASIEDRCGVASFGSTFGHRCPLTG
jgi:hypothetical protein